MIESIRTALHFANINNPDINIKATCQIIGNYDTSNPSTDLYSDRSMAFELVVYASMFCVEAIYRQFLEEITFEITAEAINECLCKLDEQIERLKAQLLSV